MRGPSASSFARRSPLGVCRSKRASMPTHARRVRVAGRKSEASSPRSTLGVSASGTRTGRAGEPGPSSARSRRWHSSERKEKDCSSSTRASERRWISSRAGMHLAVLHARRALGEARHHEPATAQSSESVTHGSGRGRGPRPKTGGAEDAHGCDLHGADRARHAGREESALRETASRNLPRAALPKGAEGCRFRKLCGVRSGNSAVSGLILIVIEAGVTSQVLGAERGAVEA